MDGGFEGLRLRHPFLDNDSLGVGAGEKALRAAVDLLERDRVFADLPDRVHHGFEFPDIALQLIDAHGRKIPAFGLAHVEHGGETETHEALRFGLLGIWIADAVLPIFGQLALHDDGAEDPDASLSLFDVPSELILPSAVSRNQGGVRPLPCDEHAVVEAVAVEAGHHGEVFHVLPRGEDLLDALFQSLQGLLQLLFSLRCGVCAFPAALRHRHLPLSCLSS